MKSLKQKYIEDVVPALKESLGVTNANALPRITKVTVNVGLGERLKDEAYIEMVENTLRAITGQQPVRTKARLSIAGFKIREGMVVGVKVTLRGEKMYAFVDKLVNIAFPRVRDFRGISPKVIDRQGNMSVGFREHLAFPEVNPDAVDTIHGLEVVITTSAQTKEEGQQLFTLLGFPFKQTSK